MPQTIFNKRLTIKSLFFCLFIISTQSVTYAVENNIPAPVKNLADYHDLLKDPKYINSDYAKLNKLRDIEKVYINSTYKDIFLSDLGTFNSYFGNYEDAHKYFSLIPSSFKGTKLDENKKILDEYKPVSVLKMIEKIGDENQAIFINEAHHVPQTRIMSNLFLETLYKKGFRYFLAESLNEKDTELNNRKYPIMFKTGYYINEPLYGDIIRQALKIGFTVIPYEHSQNATFNERELGQAKNIIDRVLKKDPKGKLIVHAGYGHITEVEPVPGFKLMAYYFKEMSGIDPYTIEQTNMREHADDYMLYEYINQKYSIKEPVMLVNKNNQIWNKNTNYYDSLIISPTTKYIHNRPDWLTLNTKKQYFQIPLNDITIPAPFAVKANLLSESIDSVPVDQLEVQNKNSENYLVLYKGDYKLSFINPDGVVFAEKIITVK